MSKLIDEEVKNASESVLIKQLGGAIIAVQFRAIYTGSEE